MAKAIRAIKFKFLILNRLLAQLPEPKSAEESLKLMGFFRNVKKALRKILDEMSDLNKAKVKKIEKETKEYNSELKPQIQQLEKIEHKTEKENKDLANLKAKVKDIDGEAAKKVKKEDDRLKEIEEEINKEEIVVNFDNESFNYIEDLFKKTPALFKGMTQDGKEVMDLDTMDDILSLFESAFNPDANAK